MLLPRLLKPHITIALSNDSCAEDDKGVGVPPSLAITPVGEAEEVDDMSNTAVDDDDRVVGLEDIPTCIQKIRMSIS